LIDISGVSVLVVSKTSLGVQVIKDRSVVLTACQRSALILCDGKRSAEEVVKLAQGAGVHLNDITALIGMGLIEANTSLSAAFVSKSMQSPVTVELSSSVTSSKDNQNFAEALNMAITLCAESGFQGFSLNMALASITTKEGLQRIAPDIRRLVGDMKYKALHEKIFS
jgi:hypothetical protein